MSGTIGGAWRNFEGGTEVEVAGQQPALTGDVTFVPESTYDDRGLLNPITVESTEDVVSTIEWFEGQREIVPQEPPVEEPPVEYSEDGEPTVYGDQDEQPDESEGEQQAADVDEGEDVDPAHVPGRPGQYCMPTVPDFDWNALPDLPVVQQYLEVFHKHKLPQGVVSDLLTLFAQNRVNDQAMLGQMDHGHADEGEAVLRADWGSDFRPILDAVKAHLKDETLFPPEFYARFKQARYPDGSLLANDAALMRYFARAAVRSERYTSEEHMEENTELAEIEALRDSTLEGEGLEAYRTLRKWGPRGDMTGDERWYDIMKSRERAAA